MTISNRSHERPFYEGERELGLTVCMLRFESANVRLEVSPFLFRRARN
jgi:hypothetical protein